MESPHKPHAHVSVSANVRSGRVCANLRFLSSLEQNIKTMRNLRIFCEYVFVCFEKHYSREVVKIWVCVMNEKIFFRLN